MQYHFQVKNLGPDLVPEAEIVIQWPYETKNGKHLLYLMEVLVRFLSNHNVMFTFNQQLVISTPTTNKFCWMFFAVRTLGLWTLFKFLLLIQSRIGLKYTGKSKKVSFNKTQSVHGLSVCIMYVKSIWCFLSCVDCLASHWN